MKKDPIKTAQDLVKIINPYNINSYTNCLTRLRIKLKPHHEVDIDKIKNYPGVLGVVSPASDEIQIVLGPGFVNSVAQEVEKILSKININPEIDFISAAKVGEKVKQEIRQKQNRIQGFFAKFSKVFSPMVIGFIGAGILAGIAGILQASVGGNLETAPDSIKSWIGLLNVSLNIWKNAFIVIVGWRVASVFGGSGVLGAIAATIYSPIFASQVLSSFVTNGTNINFLGIHISNPLTNWLTIGFQPQINGGILKFGTASGNILGAILASTASIWIEKGVRKFMPHTIDAVATPTLVLLSMLFINFFILIPISGYLFFAVSFFFQHLHANPFGAFFLATIFLTTVAFGIHQGFIPIYLILFEDLGVNSLFPILAMAGFSQIGTGIALWARAQKDSLLRQQIQGAIIPAIFGIGEPMIYGVTLPRIKPFITSSIGAGFGAFFIGAMIYWADIIFGLNSVFGPSGILASIMMTTPDGNILLAVSLYLIGALISVGMGTLITLFGYSRVANAGIAKTKGWINHIKTFNLGQRMLWFTLLALLYISVLGFVIYWIYYYYSLPKERREQWKLIKVE